MAGPHPEDKASVLLIYPVSHDSSAYRASSALKEAVEHPEQQQEEMREIRLGLYIEPHTDHKCEHTCCRADQAKPNNQWRVEGISKLTAEEASDGVEEHCTRNRNHARLHGQIAGFATALHGLI
jgi:hypothetical protein